MANVSKSSRNTGLTPKKIITRAASKKPSIELETAVSKVVTTKATKGTKTPKNKSKFNVTSPKLVTSKAIKSKASESGESDSDNSDPESKSKGWSSFIREDYERIHSWLDSKVNSEAVFGRSGKTPIGKKMKTPKEGWMELAKLLNRESRGRLSLDARSMKERFKRYKKKYRSVKLLPLSTGAGITVEDRKKGIYTITAKRESMCPFYSKMDERFGEKANVTPLGEICMNGTSYLRGVDDFDDAIEDGGDSDNSFDGQHWDGVTHEDGTLNTHTGINGNDLLDTGPDFNDFNSDQVEFNDPVVQDFPEEEIEQLSDQHVEKAPVEREQQGKQKRQHPDETADSSKRSRAKDTRKAPPKLDTGSVLQSRNGLGSAMIESSTVKAGAMLEVNSQRMAMEKEARLQELIVENRKVDFEEKKLTSEKELLIIRLKSEAENEMRKQKAIIVQSALAKGVPTSEIKILLGLVDQGLL
ncbi:hypothetical protein BGZ81_000433 [Podila clonocystis]|nr:hypothetical protein BGZ81_000433 [Podila clonocystis]